MYQLNFIIMADIVDQFCKFVKKSGKVAKES